MLAFVAFILVFVAVATFGDAASFSPVVGSVDVAFVVVVASAPIAAFAGSSFKFLGTSDDVTACDCCGRSNLKSIGHRIRASVHIAYHVDQGDRDETSCPVYVVADCTVRLASTLVFGRVCRALARRRAVRDT